eukprot:6464604-Amphidinium_carterae.1
MEGQMVVESIRDWAMMPGAKIAGQPSLLPEITQEHFTAAQQQPVPAGGPAQQHPHQQQQQQQATATGMVPSLVGALPQAVPGKPMWTSWPTSWKGCAPTWMGRKTRRTRRKNRSGGQGAVRAAVPALRAARHPGSTSSKSSSGKKKKKKEKKGKKFLQWEYKARDRPVGVEELHAISQEPFKRRADLLSFAARHKGALTASFLLGCHMALQKGSIKRSKQLRDVGVGTWAARFSSVTDVRDQREIQSIASAMDAIQVYDIEAAMDIMSQRILAIQAAKAKGSSWEKAEKLELIPMSSGGGMGSSALLSLANS